MLLSRSNYTEHHNYIGYHVGSSEVEDHSQNLQDLGTHNVKSNVHQFARSDEVPEVPISPRSCRNRTLIARSPLMFPERDALSSLLALFPVRVIGFPPPPPLAFPLLVKCHTVFTPHLLALTVEVLLSAVTCPSGGSGGGFVRLCRLLQDERPCLRNIGFYYLFKGCFHDTAISNPAWCGHKIIVGLFRRMCFIWHILGIAVQRKKIKLQCLW